MTSYNFNRTNIDGIWNINNPKDVDSNGFSVTLYERIKENPSLSSLITKMILDGDRCIINFSKDLNVEEKDTLNSIVSNHENASGTESLVSILTFTSPNGSGWDMYISDTGELQIKAST